MEFLKGHSRPNTKQNQNGTELNDTHYMRTQGRPLGVGDGVAGRMGRGWVKTGGL